MSEATPFVVFADDWGRHPSSSQHLFRHLARRHPTFWVNTIGTRAPRLDRDTLRRGWEKLRHWSRRPAPSAPDADRPSLLHVSSPLMWPWFSRGLDRRLNRSLLARHLRRLVSGKATVVTTIPLVADLVPLFPDWRWVYYCVDDFSLWPGLDQKPLEAMERDLVARCQTIIAVSETLRDKLKGWGRSSHLLTHGVDLDFWANAEQTSPLPSLAGVPRPLVVFWGVIDRRMDTAWVHRLADALDQGTVVLTGPLDHPDPTLLRPPTVIHHPPLPFADLPRLGNEAAVLVMPYADLPVTRAIQPLKLKEYLATGRPVVVRDLPANRAWADCLDLATTADEFAALVRRRLSEGVPPEQRQARLRLREEGWAARAEQFERWITGG